MMCSDCLAWRLWFRHFLFFLLTASMLVVKAEDSATSSPVTFQSLLLDMKKPDLLATWPAPSLRYPSGEQL